MHSSYRRTFNRPHHRVLLFFVLLLLPLSVLASTPLSAAANDANAQLTVVPSSGPAGSIATVTGVGFDPNVGITLWFAPNENPVTMMWGPWNITTDSSGQFVITVTIPSSWSPGSYFFQVIDENNTNVGFAPFTISETSQNFDCSQATLAFDHTSNQTPNVTDTINVFGTGWYPGGTYTVSSTLSGNYSPATIDGNGNLSYIITIADNPGTYTYTFQEQTPSCTITRQQSFTIESVGPAAITLTGGNATIIVGNQVGVTASVYDSSGNPLPNVNVVFNVNGPNANAGGVTVATNSVGQASFSYTGQNIGTDTITASAGGINSNAVTVQWSPAPDTTPPTPTPATPVPAPATSPSTGLLAPVAGGVTVQIVHGYNDPLPNESCPPPGAGKDDHCQNQQYGLDLVPSFPAAQQNASCSWFSLTHHNVCGGFQAYFEAHGGVSIFGYPLTEEFQQNGLTVQYFERARFEWHPGTKPQN